MKGGAMKGGAMKSGALKSGGLKARVQSSEFIRAYQQQTD